MKKCPTLQEIKALPRRQIVEKSLSLTQENLPLDPSESWGPIIARKEQSGCAD
jgi:hypothetical protein